MNLLQESPKREWLGAPMLVLEVMTSKLITLTPEQTFGQVVELLTQHSFRHFLVVNPDHTLAGVISDRDVLWAIAGTSQWQTQPVSAVMAQRPTTVGPETPLSAAAEIMTARRINCLPVVDASRIVVGIVTSTDLLKNYKQLQRSMEHRAQL